MSGKIKIYCLETKVVGLIFEKALGSYKKKPRNSVLSMCVRRNEGREFGDSAQNHCYYYWKKSLENVLVTEVSNVIFIYEGHIHDTLFTEIEMYNWL